MQKNEKLLVVESIRGLACFVVLISHLGLTFFPYLHGFDGLVQSDQHPIQGIIHNSPFAFFFSGASAVYIFFVLSGFILTKVALYKNDPLRVVSMCLKRYPRLMIPSLVSCVIAFFLFNFVEIESSNLSYWIYRYGDFPSTLPNAIYSGVVGSFWYGGNLYNPVLWTMQVELLGSFIIYFLCLNKIYNKIPYAALITVAILIILFLFGLFKITLFLGLLCFYAGYSYAIHGKPLSLKLSIVLLIIGLYFAGTHNTSTSYQYMVDVLGKNAYEIGNFLSGLFLVYVLIFNLKFSSFIVSKLTVFMGKVSFSVYLLHMPILSVLGVYCFEFIFSYTQWFVFSAFVTSLVVIISCYALAIYFYKYVDFKGMEISHQISVISLNILKYINSFLAKK